MFIELIQKKCLWKIELIQEFFFFFGGGDGVGGVKFYRWGRGDLNLDVSIGNIMGCQLSYKALGKREVTSS